MVVICPYCNTRAEPIQIGGVSYCSNCGQRLVVPKASQPAPTQPSPNQPAPPSPAAPITPPPLPTPRITLPPMTAPAPAPGRASMDIQPRASTPIPPRQAASVHKRAATSRAMDVQGPAVSAHVSPAVNAPTSPPAPPIIKPEPQIPRPPDVVGASLQLSAHKPAEQRIQAARNVRQSDLVSRLGARPVAPAVPVTPQIATAVEPLGPELPNAAVTHHEALRRIIDSLPAEQSQPRHKVHRKPHIGHYAAVATSITIMIGYVWLQNYPKMAVQTASNQAGITASLPGYLPSSYQLANTKTGPGLVTISFSSPSQASPLIISQQRTTWDSKSLLDRFITSQSNEYSSVTGQGLTVYLFGSNQASWVNHGIWYSITGTGRLSRDQIMKIVYSL